MSAVARGRHTAPRPCARPVGTARGVAGRACAAQHPAAAPQHGSGTATRNTAAGLAVVLRLSLSCASFWCVRRCACARAPQPRSPRQIACQDARRRPHESRGADKTRSALWPRPCEMRRARCIVAAAASSAASRCSIACALQGIEAPAAPWPECVSVGELIVPRSESRTPRSQLGDRGGGRCKGSALGMNMRRPNAHPSLRCCTPSSADSFGEQSCEGGHDWCASDGSLGRLQQGESDDREEVEEDAASPWARHGMAHGRRGAPSSR